ncbi:uncharacterized protein LOC111244978 isoform X4 [Varroa destructor]|uniref:Uncharacterized protein n=1 Tax=Varroa destructor TaxID=109461 RepID=A0A7M7JDE6_VARDE|nr:uncharacterized protein LOC111244978 isoform X4 [Varroa destructor]
MMKLRTVVPLALVRSVLTVNASGGNATNPTALSLVCKERDPGASVSLGHAVGVEVLGPEPTGARGQFHKSPKEQPANKGCREGKELMVESRGSASPQPLSPSPVAMTSQPSNESELQLYRVLQRANLLAYFDTFICQGGDDVQQLCEAGEEEFLEIMALVGMASKPLHVRRLQKALQEWVQNPAMFQSPLVSGGSGGPPTAATGGAACPSSGGGLPRGQLTQPGPGNLRPPSHGSNSSSSNSNNNSNSHNNNSNNNNSNNNSNNNNNGTSSLLPPGTSSTSTRDGQLPGQKRPASSVLDTSTTPGLIGTGATVNTPQQQPQQQQQPHGLSFSLQQNGGRLSPSSPSSGGGLGSGSVSSVSSVTSSSCLLDEQQLTKIGDVAELLVRSILPTLSPFDLKNMKKRLPKEMEFILTMSEDDPRRLEEIRRCAAIYTIPPQPTGSGKRKAASASAVPALGPYELAVNEAAAQICRHVPALLSRHEELFPLARQVVRDCAFNQFAKTDVECRSPAQTTAAGTPSASKRARAAELGFPAADKAQVEDERRKRQERLEHINEQLRSLGRQQEELKLRLGAVRDVALAAGIQQQLEQISHQQMQLLNDQNDVSKQLKRIEKFMNSPKFATIAAAAAAAAASSGSSLALGGVGSGSIDVMSVKTPGGQDTDDTDSQLSAQSFSNAASPPAPSANVVSADMANLLGNSSAMHSQQQQQHSSIGGGGGGGGVAPGGTLQQQQTSSSSIGGGRESPLIDSAAALWKQQQLQQLQQSQQHSKQQQKTSQQITKQLVQETLMDEGLRVIRELANQIKGCADTEALEAAVVAGAAVAAVASSPSSIMPLSLTCSSKQQQQQQQQQAQQQQTSAEQQSQQTNSTTTLAGGSSMNNNGGNNANNNCNSNSSNSSATGRPRGRPPRLDRGDFVGTSRTISGSSGPSPPPLSASPLNMSRPSSRSPNPPPVAGVSLGASEQSQQQSKNNNGSNSSCLLDGNPASNGHHHKSHNGSAEPENSTENSLNALLALSQKGMLKQEPGSPAPSPSPSQQSIKI